MPKTDHPRPWRVVEDKEDDYHTSIVDANGSEVVGFYTGEGELLVEDAEHIVNAVNAYDDFLNLGPSIIGRMAKAYAERDNLRDIVRRFADFIVRASRITGGVYELHGAGFHEEAVALLREAREAVGEDTP